MNACSLSPISGVVECNVSGIYIPSFGQSLSQFSILSDGSPKSRPRIDFCDFFSNCRLFWIVAEGHAFLQLLHPQVILTHILIDEGQVEVLGNEIGVHLNSFFGLRDG